MAIAVSGLRLGASAGAEPEACTAGAAGAFSWEPAALREPAAAGALVAPRTEELEVLAELEALAELGAAGEQPGEQHPTPRRLFCPGQ